MWEQKNGEEKRSALLSDHRLIVETHFLAGYKVYVDDLDPGNNHETRCSGLVLPLVDKETELWKT